MSPRHRTPCLAAALWLGASLAAGALEPDEARSLAAVAMERDGFPGAVIGCQIIGSEVRLDFSRQLLGAAGWVTPEAEEALEEVWEAVSDRLLQEGVGDAEFTTLIDGDSLERFFPPVPAAAGKAAPLTAPAAGPKVALGPGHGYYNHQTLGWTLQRSYYFGAVEDFMNMEFMWEVDAALRPMGFTHIHLRNFDRNAGNGESGRPKWQECARQHLKTIGAPSSVWNSAVGTSGDPQYNQDIRARPLYANYTGARLFVSLHNNAGGGTGTETLYDTSNGQQVESKRFADIVQAKIISRIRSQYMSTWTNRGVKGFNGNYGENRLAQCPSVIIEVGFFDKKTPDNDALQDPVFQRLVGQAIADSVQEFFSQPLLSYSGHEIDDDALGESRGNGDREIDAGETVELVVTLANSGAGPATGVRGTIEVNDPYVTVADPDTTWPDIPAGGSARSIGDFGLTVAPHCPADHPFTVVLRLESAQGQWEGTIPLRVKAGGLPDLVDAGSAFRDISRTSGLPGQTLTVSGRVSNSGSGPAGPFEIQFMASADAAVTADDFVVGRLTVPGLAAGAALSFNHSLTLPQSLPPGRFFIGWLIDPANAVTEAAEANNTAVLSTKRLTVSPPGSEVRIVESRHDPASGDCTVTFTTRLGFLYALEKSHDLTTWSRVFSGISGSGQPVSRSEPGALASRSRVFYRVVEE